LIRAPGGSFADKMRSARMSATRMLATGLKRLSDPVVGTFEFTVARLSAATAPHSSGVPPVRIRTWLVPFPVRNDVVMVIVHFFSTCKGADLPAVAGPY